MKKALSLVMILVLLIGIFSVCVSAQGNTVEIVSPNKKTLICLPLNATAQEQFAASELQKYLQIITGCGIDVANETNDEAGSVIYVGGQHGGDAPGEDSYRIKTDGEDLYIYGGGNRGTIYGVYGFLEKYCSYRRYTSEIEVIPHAETLTVPDDLDYKYDTFFEYRETDWLSPRNADYSVIHSLNGGVYRYIPENMGGTVNYIAGFCHTFTETFCSAEKYYDTHPEYFAVHNGIRTSKQLCLTNPGTLKVVTDEVLDLLKERHDPSKSVQIVSLTQADNESYCTCKNCRRLDKENGSHAGTMITFVNSIARAVKAAGYDNVALDTFAYKYTREAPTNVVPDDNVIVRLCSIECCFGHTLDDSSCSRNKDFMKDLENWSRICRRLYIWDYAINYARTVGVFPNFGVLQRNMQVFYEHNVKGVYEEGNFYMDKCDTEFGELKSYLLSKLMQNPYMDYEAEMNGFLEAYYGAGRQHIRSIIDTMTSHSATGINHLTIRKWMCFTLPRMTQKDVEACDANWQAAKQLAENEKETERIERSELSWRVWKCANSRGEFSPLNGIASHAENVNSLYDDLLSFGVTTMGEREHRAKSFRIAGQIIKIYYAVFSAFSF
ncbi:MAG: DUF4838 domain-containing protein [Clostridia bacterium]|nr:DUF4838 domain-containing protein [Clostridia bacterium]